MPFQLSEILTAQGIVALCPKAAADIVESILTAANIELPAAGIDSVEKLSHLLAQFAVETGGLGRLDENLRYTTLKALQNAFGKKRFPDAKAAAPFLKNPEALANFVYANRNGNGDTKSGDGYNFRGSGLIQLTGRTNFKNAGVATGLPLEVNPDLARKPDSALAIALSYWSQHKINSVAQGTTDAAVDAVTQKINPAGAGKEERRSYFRKALKIFTAAQRAHSFAQAPTPMAMPGSAIAAPASGSNESMLSGAHWVLQYPTSRSLEDLSEPFQGKAKTFVAALQTAGVSISIAATKRPIERAWLMHWAWSIAKKEIDPANVQPAHNIAINWVHGTLEKSRQAAKDMVAAYDLKHQAALNGRHMDGLAIDMTLSWSGALNTTDANGNAVAINSAPRNGANSELWALGRKFGVVKLPSDPPHWSSDGH